MGIQWFSEHLPLFIHDLKNSIRSTRKIIYGRAEFLGVWGLGRLGMQVPRSIPVCPITQCQMLEPGLGCRWFIWEVNPGSTGEEVEREARKQIV
jgi:hypothetical protein